MMKEAMLSDQSHRYGYVRITKLVAEFHFPPDLDH